MQQARSRVAGLLSLALSNQIWGHSTAEHMQCNARQTQKRAPAMAPALDPEPEPESEEVSVVAAPVVVAVLLLLQELKAWQNGSRRQMTLESRSSLG